MSEISGCLKLAAGGIKSMCSLNTINPVLAAMRKPETYVGEQLVQANTVSILIIACFQHAVNLSAFPVRRALLAG